MFIPHLTPPSHLCLYVLSLWHSFFLTFFLCVYVLLHLSLPVSVSVFLSSSLSLSVFLCFSLPHSSTHTSQSNTHLCYLPSAVQKEKKFLSSVFFVETCVSVSSRSSGGKKLRPPHKASSPPIIRALQPRTRRGLVWSCPSCAW